MHGARTSTRAAPLALLVKVGRADTDRWPADQVASPVDPNEEANRHQDRDGIDRARITGMNK